jgi:hypothetical protein
MVESSKVCGQNSGVKRSKRNSNLDVPVSDQASELRVAVAREQLDTVGSHGGRDNRV